MKLQKIHLFIILFIYKQIPKWEDCEKINSKEKIVNKYSRIFYIRGTQYIEIYIYRDTNICY